MTPSPTFLKTRHLSLLTAAMAATFGLGVLLTWSMMRPDASHAAKDTTAPIAESAASPRSAAAPDNAPESAEKNIVRLSEASRSGRIQTEQIVQSAVPQTGALPGKLILDENRTARLSAPVTGRVLKLFKGPGDRVAAGEVLALIDAPELSSVQAEASKAQAEVSLKSSAAKRMQELYGAGAVALKELQAAQAEDAEAHAELERTRNRLRQLNGAGMRNGAYSLVSPVAGTVTERSVTMGQQVRAEESANIFVISDLRQLNMQIDAPEAEASHFSVGQHIRLNVDGDDKALEAIVNRIGPTVDPTTRRVQIRATVDNSQGRLRPEMYVRAFGADGNRRQALELPVSSLTARGSESAIFIERAPGVYQRVPVEIVAQHPTRAWVLPLEGRGTAGAEGLKFDNTSRVVSQGALLIDSEIAAR